MSWNFEVGTIYLPTQPDGLPYLYLYRIPYCIRALTL